MHNIVERVTRNEMGVNQLELYSFVGNHVNVYIYNGRPKVEMVMFVVGYRDFSYVIWYN